MTRRALLVLLLAAVVCAGVGTGLLLAPGGVAGYGWTAYSPLSSGVYAPVDLAWLQWRPRLGAALLGLGAGTAGAVIAVLRVRRSRQPSRSSTDRSAV